MPDRTFGEIPGFPPGSGFANRRDLAASGVHRPLQAGICGGLDGAESIVVSGGYADDQDHGEELIYTGHGGRDVATGAQVADQRLNAGNAGLARSCVEGYPVRVIRGAGGDSRYSPASGLRYDGLYQVVDYWHEIGRHGFRVWRFRLVAQSEASLASSLDADDWPSPRAPIITQRNVRSSYVARAVKELHGHACQVCGVRLLTPAGPYAEVAHIRGLGRPHDGPDVLGNVLCLCPNHRVLFNAGAIYIDHDGKVRKGIDHTELAPLRRVHGHDVDAAQLAYHRAHSVP